MKTGKAIMAVSAIAGVTGGLFAVRKMFAPEDGKKKRFYLVHPLETYGSIEENRKREEKIAADIEENFPEIELVRPFKEIPTDLEDRSEALSRCIGLLSGCDGAILSGMWQCSAGCRLEFEFCKTAGKDILIYDGSLGEAGR